MYNLQLLPIERLSRGRAQYNPRKALKPGDKEYLALERSIQKFGLVDPLIWNQRTETLVGGHQRLTVLESLQWQEVPTVILDLSPEDEAILNIALNKISGAWDIKALIAVLSELDANGQDATLTGFDIRELEELLTKVIEEPKKASEPTGKPESVPGQIYELGQHRLMCGDSTNPEHVAALLNGQRPHLMVTDPPYGVNYDPKWRVDTGLIKPSNKMGVVQNDDRADWSEAWALFPGDVAYIWHSDVEIINVANSLVSSGFEIRAQIIWNKARIAISRGHYHWKHEVCFYAVRTGRSAKWHGGRKQNTVWDIQAIEDEGHGHGTQKPIECMRRPILNNSLPGDLVYDPFCGSGTTLLAADMTQRICFAMELDPGYCDIIRKRYAEAHGG